MPPIPFGGIYRELLTLSRPRRLPVGGASLSVLPTIPAGAQSPGPQAADCGTGGANAVKCFNDSGLEKPGTPRINPIDPKWQTKDKASAVLPG